MRPHVIVNAAMSADGKIALPSREGVRISNDEDLKRVHELRAACDAILVGVGTVLMDDPKLTVKKEHAKGPNPLRVILDSDGSSPVNAAVFDGAAPTLVATNTSAVRLWMSFGFEVLATVPEAFRHPTLGHVGLHIMYCRL